MAGAMVASVMISSGATIARGQVRPVPSRPLPPAPLSVRGFADADLVVFTAADSFEAVLGSRAAPVFGFGGEVVFPQQFFAGVRVSWFQKTGERVFAFDGETFPLGIETKVRIMPVEIAGGYRFRHAARRVIPYAGGGIGWHRYEETSDFATDEENVSETHLGFHVLGGADVRVARLVRVGGEVQWSTVPDALGQDSNSVAAAFGEDNLGGTAVRVKIIIGR